MSLVLDSSVVGCWCFPDEENPIADAAFDQLGAGEAIVPVPGSSRYAMFS
jgi:hypothetical protein